ncbi:MAG TPA: VOC family protein [Acidimicrobiales bacterium]|nr:VOC family protein [Acidimicrobiales bacterium]
MDDAPITTGFGHVATLTPDLDRYLAFYTEMFGARVTGIIEAGDDHPKMAMVDMGQGSQLNVFEVPGDGIVGDRGRTGGRGPIDHYAVAVGSAEDLEAVRDRLVAAGSSPGEITEFGPLLSVFFRDPDGAELEVTFDRAAAGEWVFSPVEAGA